ncbi:MAG: efflux RND transporter periplasmic adaptor subunit [Salinisphaera sp.]|jgi:RND family efflux transporter MFP subunit|nr:efflux RND transporter periplasmic adaptor subunit [Salinisphaera sp.]
MIHGAQRSTVDRLTLKAVGACAIALLISLGGCDRPASDQQSSQVPANTHTSDAKTVQVAAVRKLDRARTYTLAGTTRAASRAQLSFQVNGTLTQRSVDLGTRVKKGEVLARLSQPELKPEAAAAAASVRQMSSQLAQARRNLARVKTLVSKDAATQQELEDARSRRDSLVAGLARARAQSRRASNSAHELTLKAPIDGTVDRVMFEPGEFVPAGQPVIALSGARKLEVEIGVPEQLIGTLTLGEAANLSLPFFDNRPIKGIVTRVSAGTGGDGRLFRVVISLPDQTNLRPGLSVEWHIKGARQTGLLVPANAVASPGSSHHPRVYVVRAGVVHSVPVTLGELFGDQVSVRGALQPGEQVVTVGLDNLSDGRAVAVPDNTHRARQSTADGEASE